MQLQTTVHDWIGKLLSRQDPNTPRYPYPFDLADPEGEVETLLKEHLNRSK
jgi:hypothetical protein